MIETRKFYNVFEYISVLLIVLQCQSVFTNAGHSVSMFIGIPTIICIFLLCVLTILKKGLDTFFLNSRLINFLILNGFSLLLYLLIEYFFIYKFQFNPLVPFFLSILFITIYFYFSKDINNPGIIKKIINVVMLLCLFSLLFYFLYSIGMKTNVSLPNNWGTGFSSFNGYFYLDFISQVIPGTNILRNSGVFAEPSIFGFVIVSAIVMQVFILGINKRNDFIKIIIFLITVISTTSTTAIVISLAIILVKILFNSKRKKIISLFGFFLLMVGIPIFKWLYLNKASGITDIYSSYAVRSNDVYACVQTWMHHLFLGVGIGNNNYIGQYMYSYRSVTGYGLSTGLLAILAYGGIFMLMFYIIPCLLTFFKSKRLFIAACFINFYLFYASVQETYLLSVFIGYFWAYTLRRKTGGKVN